MTTTSIQWTDRKGRALGAFKSAAKRIGVSFDSYQAHLSIGENWCIKCKSWHDCSAFGRDSTRWNGLASACLASRSTGKPRGWHGRQPINPATGRPGAARKPRRDGDKRQARSRINHDVTIGLIPNPNSLPCTDCGHLGPGKRHEYDHYLGYAAAHHYDVQAVCSSCHHDRERQRRLI